MPAGRLRDAQSGNATISDLNLPCVRNSFVRGRAVPCNLRIPAYGCFNKHDVYDDMH